MSDEFVPDGFADGLGHGRIVEVTEVNIGADVESGTDGATGVIRMRNCNVRVMVGGSVYSPS